MKKKLESLNYIRIYDLNSDLSDIFLQYREDQYNCCGLYKYYMISDANDLL